MASCYNSINKHIGAKAYRELKNRASANQQHDGVKLVITGSTLRRADLGETLSIVDRHTEKPSTFADMMLAEIQKRLQSMRDISLRAASLHLSDQELKACQDEIDRFKDEITSFAESISSIEINSGAAVRELIETDMKIIDNLVSRVSDIVENREVKRDECDEDRPQRADKLLRHKKITLWMNSITKDWI